MTYGANGRASEARSYRYGDDTDERFAIRPFQSHIRNGREMAGMAELSRTTLASRYVDAAEFCESHDQSFAAKK